MTTGSGFTYEKVPDGVVCQDATTDSDSTNLPLSTEATAAPSTLASTTAAPTTVTTDKPVEETNSPTSAQLTTASEAIPMGAQTTTEEVLQDLTTTQTPAKQTTAPETANTQGTTTQEDHVPTQQTTETVTSSPATSLTPIQTSFLTTAGPTDSQTTEDSPETESTTISETMTVTHAKIVLAVVQCVDKEEVSNKDAVELKLQEASSCEHTRDKLLNISMSSCKHACTLYIYQQEGSPTVIITGPGVEGNVKDMAEMFNREDNKEKLGVMEAFPVWGKHPPTVLVALLVSGLLLAALLIAGYCLKERRSHSSKGMRLAEESYQADEENQGNTLVSVAPLNPPETHEKPSLNGGESPDGGKSQPQPTATNGHSTTKAPVADTEL
ncbi:hypothetical protein JZ751_014789 [Albula glossodonta]|uniref:Uncharacterized protein n=1 Tax=Albula glossodonta TaxID=121402 RepID=A0A8T2N2L5_9TELE|nr:hypothetical protein JZ751_014789 [Albula glossodonta]